MALSPEGTTDRREAAVAAALAGAVVVVLGYASGLGIETASPVVAIEQLPTEATDRESVVRPSTHAVAGTGAGASHHPAGHVAHGRHAAAPAGHDHAPTTPGSPTPSIPPEPEPEPEPEPPTPECDVALLPSLPLLPGLTQAVSSLLSGVAGDELGCAVAEILDPSSSAAARAARQDVRR